WLLVAGLLLLIGGLVGWSYTASARRVRLRDALYNAVDNDDLAGAELALKRGANPNDVPSDWEVMWNSMGRWSLLLKPPVLRVALERRQHGDFRWPPALYDARDPAVTRLLLRWGADPNGAAWSGCETPLMDAAWRGDLARMRALLEGGARVDQRDGTGRAA